MKAWQWVWSCWMGFSMQKLQIDKEATGIYITRSSLKTEFAICSHSSTQYRNEIVADGIEVRYRLPEKHQGSTLNDNTNTNSVSFDLIQFHLGTFSPSRFHVEPRLLSLSHFLSFSFFPLYIYFLFLFPSSLPYQPTLHHFLSPAPSHTIVNFSPFSPFSWSQSLASSRQADSDLGFGLPRP